MPSRQQLGHIRRSEELAAGLAGVAGVHGHEIFIGILESVNIVVLHITQVHVGHTVEELYQLFIPLG